MRAALLIVLGLVIGILGTVFAYSALHQRTPLPKAVMTVMAYHSSQLHHAVKANQCDAAAIHMHLERLRATDRRDGRANHDVRKLHIFRHQRPLIAHGAKEEHAGAPTIDREWNRRDGHRPSSYRAGATTSAQAACRVRCDSPR